MKPSYYIYGFESEIEDVIDSLEMFIFFPPKNKSKKELDIKMVIYLEIFIHTV